MSAQSETRFIIILGLLIGLSPFAVDMYLPSLPTIGADLGASPELVQQTLSVYLACFALPQLFFGPLSDALGRRVTLLLGLTVFMAGSLLCVAARDIGELILARGLQGIGAAAVLVTVPALVRDRFAGDEFARMMGFIMLVMALAPLVAPLVGGLVLSLSGWRSIFLVLAGLGLIGLLLFVRYLGETLPPERRESLRPRRLLANYGSLLKHRPSLSFMLCGGFGFAGMMAFLTASPFVYIDLYGISAQNYGLLFSLNILTMMVFTALANRFVRRIGVHRMLGLGMLVLALASVIMGGLAAWGAPPLVVLVASIMLFVGTNGMVSANTMALVMNRFGHISGSASAMAGFLRFGIGALAGVLVGVLHDGTIRPLLIAMVGCGVLAVAFYGIGSLRGDRAAEMA